MRQKTASDFVHLHNHSEFSLLDGASRVDDMVVLAAEYGMEALALTDHGNMFGAVQFYKAAQRAGVKPIVGAEVYVAPGDRREKKQHRDIPESSFHLTLLCRDETGYRNLIKLVSYGFLDGFYYKPRIDRELLAEHSAGLIGLSGCLKGEVSYHLRRGDAERAMQAASRYQEALGPDNFFLEVMRSGLPEQEQIVPGIMELSGTLDIPVVATNDCHYLRPDDARAQDALVCIQTGKKLSDRDRLRMTNGQFYFRSGEEMARVFADMPDAVRRTREVAERCNLILDYHHTHFHLPEFRPPAGFDDAFAYLRHLAREGLERRYGRPEPTARERLEHELEVIRRMGFAGYFLVVKEIVDYARQSGIPVGPGRGSAAGSLVLYCLDITQIDPLRYGLLFERFLTTERVTLPDVDIDFSDARRPEVIRHIRERYGNDSVAQIVAFGTMQARAAVRDVGRVLDVPIAEVDRIAKLIPFGMELGRALKDVPELRLLVESRPEYRELWTIARKLEGLSRHASVHPSAVVIAPRPLMEFVPLYKPPEKDSEVCTQFDMYSLDNVGLLKMDILGLRTLTVVEEATRLVRAAKPDFDVNRMPLDDGPTYELLRRADTVGVFQLESAGMRDLCRRLQPEKLEHIIALIALYRPGPMELIPQFLARKAGNEPVECEHSLLDPICRETYGIMIYQEQVMQAAQALAGYSLGKADLLRRAMGKKKPDEMAAQRQDFVDGCVRHAHMTRERAQRIFDLLEKFAGYGFNKSHAAGYAYLSFLTACLKANFPREFVAATLTSELGDSKKLAKFVSEARRMGIPVLRPDVNRSAVAFTIEEDAVRFGLAGVKGVGMGASEVIVAEREARGPYRDLLEFLKRNRAKKVNRKAVEALIKAGAFDSFEPNRSLLLGRLDEEMAKASSDRLLFRERQFDMFTEPDRRESEPGFDAHALLACEKEAFGFYFSSHPLEPFRAEYEAFRPTPIAQLEGMKDGTKIVLGGVITSRRTRKDKRDREYIIVTVEDFEGGVEVLVFADQLESARPLLAVDTLVAIQGTVRVRQAETEGGAGQGAPQIWADRVYDLRNCCSWFSTLFVVLPEPSATKELLLRIRDIVARHPGEKPVFLELLRTGDRPRHVQLREVRVDISNRLIEELRQALGPDRLRLVAELPRPENSRPRREFRKNSRT